MKRQLCAVIGCIVTVVIGMGNVCAADVEVLDPLFLSEKYASYSCPGTDYHPREITFDNESNLYLSHWESYDTSTGSIYRVTPDGTATKWVDGLPLPRRIVSASGTAYDDYLYVGSGLWGDSAILQVKSDGTYKTFASISRAPHALALDRYGSYGGYMYAATRANDHIYYITPEGIVFLFSEFPSPGNDGGGPTDFCFDPGLEYGGFMYMATDFLGAPDNSGLFALDISGNPTRFAPDILGASNVEIDTIGLFSGSLFVSGRIGPSRDVPTSIWRVSPDGVITEFAISLLAPSGLPTFTFGPDGAMYIPEIFPDSETVVITRISPIPAPGAFVLGGIGVGMVASSVDEENYKQTYYQN